MSPARPTRRGVTAGAGAGQKVAIRRACDRYVIVSAISLKPDGWVMLGMSVTSAIGSVPLSSRWWWLTSGTDSMPAREGALIQRLILGFALTGDLRFPCSAQRSVVDTP
jgi:hypothetical protein